MSTVRGTIDEDGRLSLPGCRHRARGRSGPEEHTDDGDGRVGRTNTVAAARLTGRAAMANIVAGMKYRILNVIQLLTAILKTN